MACTRLHPLLAIAVVSIATGCATLDQRHIVWSVPSKETTSSTIRLVSAETQSEIRRTPPIDDGTQSDPRDAEFNSNADTVSLALHQPFGVERPLTWQLASNAWLAISEDHAEFYSGQSLRTLGLGVGIGAIMANTGIDEHFLRDLYRENVVDIANEGFAEKLHEPKFAGEHWYVLGAYSAAVLSEPLLGNLVDCEHTTLWGQRSLRATLVGAPIVYALQLGTGGSRPGESAAESKWKPFDDNNGVSGHSFVAAVPFLIAADMTEDRWLRFAFHSASTLTAISRVNDDGHYASQAFLGWWVAHVASRAVHRADMADAPVQITPVISAKFSGVSFSKTF